MIKELKASSFQPTSDSVAALRDYNQGVELLREGKNLDAVKSLQAAVKEDRSLPWLTRGWPRPIPRWATTTKRNRLPIKLWS